MKYRRILDAAIVGALLLAHVPGMAEALPLEEIPAPVALLAPAQPEGLQEDAHTDTPDEQPERL